MTEGETMSKCETCKYCTEVGKNAAGAAVMRRCIRKNGHRYEDKVTEVCEDYVYTDDPYATNSAKCVTCRFCAGLAKNDTGCPVSRQCTVRGETSEDFVVFDCPDYQIDGRQLLDDNGSVSFGERAAKPVKAAESANGTREEKPEKPDDNKSTIKIILIICAVFLGLILLIKVIGSSGLFGNKEKTSVDELPTDAYETSGTLPDFTLPEITTEEPTFITVTMNEPAFVTSDVGLKLRSSAGTDGDELAVMPYMAELAILSEEDGWAYVDYNGMKGWCSEDYLEKGTLTTYTADEVASAISTANNVIASYCGRVLTNGKSMLETAYVITYFQEAEKLYKQFVTDPGTLFDETHEDLKCSGGLYSGKYFRVSDDRFTSVESLCEYFFTYFSDDVAKRMLNNKVISLGGNLYVYYGSSPEQHAKVVTEPAVVGDLNTYNVDITVKVYDDPLDVNLMTNQYVISCPCSLLNGRWVFTHMEVIPE